MIHKKTILIIDDHPLFREGFKAIIQANKRLEVLAKAENTVLKDVEWQKTQARYSAGEYVIAGSKRYSVDLRNSEGIL